MASGTPISAMCSCHADLHSARPRSSANTASTDPFEVHSGSGPWDKMIRANIDLRTMSLSRSTASSVALPSSGPAEITEMRSIFFARALVVRSPPWTNVDRKSYSSPTSLNRSVGESVSHASKVAARCLKRSLSPALSSPSPIRAASSAVERSTSRSNHGLGHPRRLTAP